MSIVSTVSLWMRTAVLWGLGIGVFLFIIIGVVKVFAPIVRKWRERKTLGSEKKGDKVTETEVSIKEETLEHDNPPLSEKPSGEKRLNHGKKEQSSE